MKQLLPFKIFFLFAFCVSFSCGHEEKKAFRKVVPEYMPQELNHILLVYTLEVPRKYVDTAQRHLQKAFGLEVKLLESPGLPRRLMSTIHKERYRADSLLRYLRQTYTDKALKLILLTHHDISTTKYSNQADKVIKKPESRYRDWGIFGLGSCPGYCCVVSINRLRMRKAKEKTFVQRMKNISVHEVGHTFGLPHCPEPLCVMNDANETILTVDKSTGIFCTGCKSQLGF